MWYHSNNAFQQRAVSRFCPGHRRFSRAYILTSEPCRITHLRSAGITPAENSRATDRGVVRVSPIDKEKITLLLCVPFPTINNLKCAGITRNFAVLFVIFSLTQNARKGRIERRKKAMARPKKRTSSQRHLADQTHQPYGQHRIIR